MVQQNTVLRKLHRSKRISSNFKIEIKLIIRESNTDYYQSVSHLPQNSNSFLISSNLFEESKAFNFFEMPHSEESVSKYLIKKIEIFINFHYRLAVKWLISKEFKVEVQLFNIKSQTYFPQVTLLMRGIVHWRDKKNVKTNIRA